jgi:hypothetical protein
VYRQEVIKLTVYNWLSLLLGSGILLTIFRALFVKIQANETKMKSIQAGVQALLRDRLIAEYNEGVRIGYARIYDKENFENMWTQYHNLGANGVMDEIRDKYRGLPTESPAEEVKA